MGGELLYRTASPQRHTERTLSVRINRVGSSDARRTDANASLSSRSYRQRHRVCDPLPNRRGCHYPFEAGAEGVIHGIWIVRRGEQKDQDVDTDDDNAVNVHENDHDGEVTIEGGASTDDLVGRLSEMKDDEDDE